MAPASIFDIDDAVWTRPNKPYSLITGMRVKNRLHYWLKHSSCVLASNNLLKNYASQFNSNIETLPMALDLNIWKPITRSQDKLHIGWAGSPPNLIYIEQIDPYLVRLKKDFPNIEFKIYSGQKPKLKVEHKWEKFSPGTEAAFVQHLDIGLLPLKEDEFTNGKSPIKSIQYMSCAVAVVGNINGVTKELLNAERAIPIHEHSDWYTAISYLIRNPSLIEPLGQNGLNYVSEHNNYDKIKYRFLDILKKYSKHKIKR